MLPAKVYRPMSFDDDIFRGWNIHRFVWIDEYSMFDILLKAQDLLILETDDFDFYTKSISSLELRRLRGIRTRVQTQRPEMLDFCVGERHLRS